MKLGGANGGPRGCRVWSLPSLCGPPRPHFTEENSEAQGVTARWHLSALAPAVMGTDGRAVGVVGPSQRKSCLSSPPHRQASRGPWGRGSLASTQLSGARAAAPCPAGYIPALRTRTLVPSLTLAAALVLLFLLLSVWLVWDSAPETPADVGSQARVRVSLEAGAWHSLPAVPWANPAPSSALACA